MRWFAIIAVCVLALAGCKKKKPAATPTDSGPAPAIKADGLPAESPPPTTGGAGGGGGSGGIIAAGGGIGVVNSQQALGGGGGGGAVMAVRKAARRANAMNELKNIGEIIFAMQVEDGRMPTVDRIKEELKRTPQLYAGVTEGAYVLTGTTEPGGLYAHEVNADREPGIAVIGGRAVRSTPEELQPYFRTVPRPQAQPQPKAPQPAPQPMGKIDNRPPQPQAQPAAPAARVTQQDMEEVRLFIDNRSGATGQMPTPQETSAALKQAASPQTVTLIQSKAITIAPARTREDVWAYETAALQRGGLVATAGGVETMTADTLRRRLGGR
ncbi:hypothetical protein J0H58_06690 [bacterium]|nr:hypothetical protein [bacterium]